jgi:hypothetical protein
MTDALEVVVELGQMLHQQKPRRQKVQDEEHS